MKKLISYLTTLIFLFSCSALISNEHIHSQPYQHQLSVVAIFQNEAPYLKEWIEYHKLIGVDHFYLYNNLSNDHYYEVLKPYIDNKEVDLIEWPYEANDLSEWNQIQINAYQDAIDLAKYNSKWLAILDVDEFITPCYEDQILHILQKYETSTVGGICLIWSFFGTSNIQKIPENKLMIETLLYHSGPAKNGNLSAIWNSGSYKSIVRPEFVSYVTSPHYCIYVSGKYHSMVSYHLVHINHYWTRDEYYLNNFKIPRRKKWGQTAESVKKMAEKMNKTKDNNPILKFIPKLRKQMKFPSTTNSKDLDYSIQ